MLILDPDVVVHDVAVRLKSQCVGDAQPVAVLADQLQFSGARTLRQPERLGEIANAIGFGGLPSLATVNPSGPSSPRTTIGRHRGR